MKISTGHATGSDVRSAVNSALDQVDRGDIKPKLYIFSCTVSYDLDQVYQAIKDRVGDTPFQGGTSSGGIMTEKGWNTDPNQQAIGIIAFSDETAEFGIGSAPKGEDPRAAGKQALINAIAVAGREGEIPDAIWFVGSPGGEEDVIEGINDVAGKNIPLQGGSSADNTIEGHWRQFTNEGVFENHVTLVAFFLEDQNVSRAFHSGYEASKHGGTVTKADGRVLYEIDGKNAADVYNEWTGGAITEAIESQGNILALSNLFPIGRQMGLVGTMPYYLLSHPETVTVDKAITLFTNVQEGDQLICMQGTVDDLVDRAGNVAAAALERAEIRPENIEGALVIFCAGCMMTVGDRMHEAVENIKKALHGKPFFGMCTFGEQGSLAGGENMHGNLMISTLVFSNKKD